MTRFDITFTRSDGSRETVTVDDPQDIGGYVTGVYLMGRRQRICKVDDMTGLVRSDMARLDRVAAALRFVSMAVDKAKGEVSEETWKALYAMQGVIEGFESDVYGLMDEAGEDCR